MARQLRAPVWVNGQWFRPGDEIPAELADQISGDVWVNDGQPAADGPTPPPMGGAGSGVDAWTEYAQAVGVEIPEEAKRDDIVAAIAEAGHPVE